MGALSAADIRSAVDADILTEDQAERLQAHAKSRRTPAGADEEELRFIRNFHDVFLAAGLVILFAGLAIASGLAGLLAPAGLVASAVVAWGLAEVFSARRRLFFPSIVIAAAFAGFFALATLFVFVLPLDEGVATTSGRAMNMQMLVLPPFAGAVASTLFYLRFRLPFATALIAVSITYTLAIALASAGLEDPLAALPVIILAAGVGTFIAAMIFDARDPDRVTRYSDNAFWLHFAAAPQIVHGAVSLSFGRDSMPGAAEAGMLLGVILGLATISLLVNRRALLVSSLLYAGIAIGVLISSARLEGPAVAALTLVLLGLLVVLLGAGWHSLRKMLIASFPRTGLVGRLIPPAGSLE
jgi:hypothetical protein